MDSERDVYARIRPDTRSFVFDVLELGYDICVAGGGL